MLLTHWLFNNSVPRGRHKNTHSRYLDPLGMWLGHTLNSNFGDKGKLHNKSLRLLPYWPSGPTFFDSKRSSGSLLRRWWVQGWSRPDIVKPCQAHKWPQGLGCGAQNEEQEKGLQQTSCTWEEAVTFADVHWWTVSRLPFSSLCSSLHWNRAKLLLFGANHVARLSGDTVK